MKNDQNLGKSGAIRMEIYQGEIIRVARMVRCVIIKMLCPSGILAEKIFIQVNPGVCDDCFISSFTGYSTARESLPDSHGASSESLDGSVGSNLIGNS